MAIAIEINLIGGLSYNLNRIKHVVILIEKRKKKKEDTPASLNCPATMSAQQCQVTSPMTVTK